MSKRDSVPIDQKFVDGLNRIGRAQPIPSKEPSVDEILDNLEGYLVAYYSYKPPQTWSKSLKGRTKAQLLALHLGCLPEKIKSEEIQLIPTGTDRDYARYCAGFASAIDLVEQKLREMYGDGN